MSWGVASASAGKCAAGQRAMKLALDGEACIFYSNIPKDNLVGFDTEQIGGQDWAVWQKLDNEKAAQKIGIGWSSLGKCTPFK